MLKQWFPNFFEPLPKSRYRLCLITLNTKFSHFRSKISFAVIAHNTEQECGFALSLSPEKSHITPSLGTSVLKAFLNFIHREHQETNDQDCSARYNNIFTGDARVGAPSHEKEVSQRKVT